VIELDGPLAWADVGAIAEGAPLCLSAAAAARIAHARSLVESLLARRIRAYGVNTGVGALCDVLVEGPKQRELSRNIVMSHAVGVGAPLGARAVRAIMAAAINNFARGYSGLRPEVVAALVALLNADCVPEVPSGGSVGYLTHMAHIALVLLGAGSARMGGRHYDGAAALRACALTPVCLEAKEGLSLVNGTPCAAGLAALALLRSQRLLDWMDLIAAMSFENLEGQLAAFDAGALGLRASPGLEGVGAALRRVLAGSARLAASAGRRTQDALSLRAIAHVHGAARDVHAFAATVVDRELAAVTDNPIVTGTVAAPRAHAEAHAVGAALASAADALAIALAQVAAMSERRIDRLVNPLVSGLPAFLAAEGGASSGFMIAHYTAVALVGDNRRLAAPASLDGGVTSGLQEDHLSHATPAALKLLALIDNAETIAAIELLASAQAYDMTSARPARAPGTESGYALLRAEIGSYRDDRPLADDIASALVLLRGVPAPLPPAPPCAASPGPALPRPEPSAAALPRPKSTGPAPPP
jgi:histidine ammonia-lyase